MKQFIDFIPLILFFIVYKIDPQNVEFAGFNLSGIYGATATLILASVIVYGALWLKHRHLEKSQWFTLGACLVLGGLTLAFHEDPSSTGRRRWSTGCSPWPSPAVTSSATSR